MSEYTFPLRTDDDMMGLRFAIQHFVKMTSSFLGKAHEPFRFYYFTIRVAAPRFFTSVDKPIQDAKEFVSISRFSIEGPK